MSKPKDKRKSIGVKTCGDCGTVVLPTGPQIRCDKCKKTFHAACKNVDERVCRKLKRDGTPWLCNECDADEEEGEEENEENVELSSLKGILIGIQKQLTDLTKQNADVVKSQQYLSDNYDKLIEQITACNEANKQLSGELSSLTTKYALLSEELKQLKGRTNANEQTNLASNVLIRGVSDDDDPLASVQKIADLIEMTDQIGDKTKAKRITYEGKHTVIYVTFADNDVKRKFVRAAKAKRISTQMFGYDGEPKPIYVDEQVTKDTFMLFLYAKKLKKIGCKFVWLSNGRVLTRINEESEFVQITQRSQVDEIETKLLLKPTVNESEMNNGVNAPHSRQLHGVNGERTRNDKKKDANHATHARLNKNRKNPTSSVNGSD